MGKIRTTLVIVAISGLLSVITFLIFHTSRQQAMSFFSIPNSPLELAITKSSDGRLHCQLFENGHSISGLHPLSSDVPFRQYKWFVDETISYDSNIATISWLAEDGWDGDLYRVVIDMNARRLVAGSNVWSVAEK